MSNTNGQRSGGFGLGVVAVVGVLCFAAGYLVAAFGPALTGSGIKTSTRSNTRTSIPHSDESEGRATDGASDREPVSEAAPEKPAEPKPSEPAKEQPKLPPPTPTPAPAPAPH